MICAVKGPFVGTAYLIYIYHNVIINDNLNNKLILGGYMENRFLIVVILFMISQLSYPQNTRRVILCPPPEGHSQLEQPSYISSLKEKIVNYNIDNFVPVEVNGITGYADDQLTIGLSLKVKQSKIKIGECPVLLPYVKNLTNQDVVLVTPWDGSVEMSRFPYFYIEIKDSKGKNVPYNGGWCATYNNLTMDALFELKPLEENYILNTICPDQNCCFDSLDIFHKPGKYTIRVVYSTDNSENKSGWVLPDRILQEREYDELIKNRDETGCPYYEITTKKHLKELEEKIKTVPRITVISNLVEIEVIFDKTEPIREGSPGLIPPTFDREKLYDNLVYPKVAISTGLEGYVIVDTVFKKNGNIGDVKVIGGLRALDFPEEAISAIKKLEFKPGSLNGELVDVIMSIPVKFKY